MLSKCVCLCVFSPVISTIHAEKEQPQHHWGLGGWGDSDCPLVRGRHVHFWECGLHQRRGQDQIPYLCRLWDWTNRLALFGWQEKFLHRNGKGGPCIVRFYAADHQELSDNCSGKLFSLYLLWMLTKFFTRAHSFLFVVLKCVVFIIVGLCLSVILMCQHSSCCNKDVLKKVDCYFNLTL